MVANFSAAIFAFFLFTALLANFTSAQLHKLSLPESDVDLLEFPLNLEYLEAEFFLWGSLGHGLDKEVPQLAEGGPAPIGGRKANLDPLINDVVLQFAYQEVGHLRAIKKTVKGFPRPQLDISAAHFAKIVDEAFEFKLNPPFDPYANGVNYLIASYIIPYVGLTGYVGASPKLQSAKAKRLVAGLLGVESAQDAVIRGLLYERAGQKVLPYNITVAEFTSRISNLRNKLGKRGVKDEGLVVPLAEGPECKTHGNIIAGDVNSVAYDRTPAQILRIVYGTGNESIPGGFYPKGADGHIARYYRH
ncbi:Desiccation-related protein PCC13-62 [Rhynchospora pubera]|uniref:Desiccation-related protein PCC13-62 n=1 Tax=Rhynchospora pubera TaxID=906938 RepID=A0AAV8FIF8_9POAL|nr:Desiccation-related protein PCC13-62 [Rhynchospora pubera]